MKTCILTVAVLTVALLRGTAAFAGATAISGDYLEARTSDVYTGSCFANAEVNLAGREAIVAWRVREGAWNGVAVDGLSVAAAVRAAATLGDPHADPYPGRAVILVDERATPEQRDALVGFARAMGGDLLGEVVAVQAAPIRLDVQGAAATLRAGGVIDLATRGLNHHDHLCGNEEVYYPPLTEVAEAVPAVTLEHAFRGEGLGMTWSSPGKRSAFVGRFAR